MTFYGWARDLGKAAATAAQRLATTPGTEPGTVSLTWIAQPGASAREESRSLGVRLFGRSKLCAVMSRKEAEELWASLGRVLGK